MHTKQEKIFNQIQKLHQSGTMKQQALIVILLTETYLGSLSDYRHSIAIGIMTFGVTNIISWYGPLMPFKNIVM